MIFSFLVLMFVFELEIQNRLRLLLFNVKIYTKRYLLSYIDFFISQNICFGRMSIRGENALVASPKEQVVTTNLSGKKNSYRTHLWRML